MYCSCKPSLNVKKFIGARSAGRGRHCRISLVFLAGSHLHFFVRFHLHFLSSQHLSVSQHSSSLLQQSSICCSLPHASSLQQVSVSQHSSSFSQQSSSVLLEQFSSSWQHSVGQQFFSSSQQPSTTLLDILCGSDRWLGRSNF